VRLRYTLPALADLSAILDHIAANRRRVTDEIVFVQPVHDQDDGARQLVLQMAVVEPFVCRTA
jgi:hypothetical protein